MKPSPHVFRNLTPHRITVFGSFLTPTGEPAAEWYIEPDPAGPARVSVTAEPNGHHAGIPIATPTYGDVTGLPAPADETLLIVSKMVADACPERQDLVWPGDPVRDDTGRVIGCRALHRHGASGMPPAGSLRRLWDVLRAAYGVDDPEQLADVAVAARETRMRGMEALCRALGHHPAKCPPVEEMAAELEQRAAAGQPEPAAQKLPTIELPGLDAALEKRRAAEQRVIRMACQWADERDRHHIIAPGLMGAVEALRGWDFDSQKIPGRFSLGALDLVPSEAARAWRNLSDVDRRDAIAIIRERGLTRAAAALEELSALMAAVYELDHAMDRASGACGLACLQRRQS